MQALTSSHHMQWARSYRTSQKEYRKYKAPFPVASPLAPPRPGCPPRFRTPPPPRAGRLAGRLAARWPQAGGDTGPACGWVTGRRRHQRLLQAASARGVGATWGPRALPLTPAP